MSENTMSAALPTRLGEYKRSPHESSIRVPFVVVGPRFNRSSRIDQVASPLDLAPTLLNGAGLQPPKNMRGKPLKSFADNLAARDKWDSTVYFQISESICGRGIRTRDWCYCACDPTVPNGEAEYSAHYQDFALYSIAGDPAETVNLVWRPEYNNIANELRAELQKRIVAAGESEAVITPVHIYA